VENPFCSRRIRPGALPFLFAVDESLDKLIERLRRSGWWGQIVGPHGSGKSALLAALVPSIERAGRHAVVFQLHNSCRRLLAEFRQAVGSDSATVLVIDGYEQLGRWSRFRLKRYCRQRGLGLLATAHSSVGLPDLFRTEVDLDLARKVVEQLGQGYPPHVDAADVTERFRQRDGNLRETLFDLYDLYEERRRR